MNAFSLEHVPHIIVVTSVSPIGANCGRRERRREGEEEGGEGKERRERGRGREGEESLTVVLAHEFIGKQS